MMILLNQETNVKNRPVTAWFKQKPSGETDGEPVPFPTEPTYIGAIERSGLFLCLLNCAVYILEYFLIFIH